MAEAATASRKNDWERRMFAAIEESRGRQFNYGSADCALFAADVVKAMTGVDYGAKFRGRYANAAGASRYGTLEEIFTRTLGPPCDKSCLSNGDVALVKVQGQHVIGVVQGGGALCRCEKDFVRIPMRKVLKGWRI